MSLNSTDDSLNIEQFGDCAKKWIVVGVEAENVVAKMFADIKKVTGAAAEIENVQWRRSVEPEVLRPLDVDVDPISDVLETIDPRRGRTIRKLLAQAIELQPIDVIQYPTFVDGMRPAAEMFGRAGEKFARKNFLELA